MVRKALGMDKQAAARNQTVRDQERADFQARRAATEAANASILAAQNQQELLIARQAAEQRVSELAEDGVLEAADVRLQATPTESAAVTTRKRRARFGQDPDII